MTQKIFHHFLLFALLLLHTLNAYADKTTKINSVTTVESIIRDFHQSYTHNMPYPLHDYLTSITKSQAYTLQRQFVKKLLQSDHPIGYKAGLTSQAAQQRFQVTAPVAGVLLSSAHIKNHQLDSRHFHKMMLETEIGFIVAKSITKSQINIENLNSFFSSIVAVIEAPDLAYGDLKKLTAQHLVATNVATRQFITGPEKPIQSINLNKLQSTLFRDKTIINKGKATDALGDQWQALQWLVNRTLASGWSINKGDILITGALGKMLLAKPGNYRAEFGELGTIEFSVIADTSP